MKRERVSREIDPFDCVTWAFCLRSENRPTSILVISDLTQWTGQSQRISSQPFAESREAVPFLVDVEATIDVPDVYACLLYTSDAADE